MEEKNTKKDLLLKLLFIIGIIVLIFIFAYALIKIVPRVFSGLASVGQFITSPFSSNDVDIRSDKTDLNSGDNFTLSWNYANTDKPGYYAVSYVCQENLSIKMLTSAEDSVNILCNTPYNLRMAQNATFNAVLNENNIFRDLTMKIEYFESGTRESLASGEINLNVTRESINAGEAVIISEPIEPATTAPVVRPSAGTPSRPTVTQPINYGPADLSISNAYALSDQSITFNVTNIGGQSSGAWYFTYVDASGQVESSPTQPSLARGQGIRYTLTFDNRTPSGNVAIVVDPKNQVVDANRSNNVVSVRVNTGGSGSGSNNGGYNPNDDADLTITDMEVGRLSGSRFVRDSEIEERDEAAVRFVVKNIGGENTGRWRYEITGLPYDTSNDDYRSSSQNSLRPGESIEIIIGFDNPDEGRYTVRAEVDSDNDVREENERNNTDSKTLRVAR